jgi:hypothetical protein
VSLLFSQLALSSLLIGTTNFSQQQHHHHEQHRIAITQSATARLQIWTMKTAEYITYILHIMKLFLAALLVACMLAVASVSRHVLHPFFAKVSVKRPVGNNTHTHTCTHIHSNTYTQPESWIYTVLQQAAAAAAAAVAVATSGHAHALCLVVFFSVRIRRTTTPKQQKP